MNNKIPVRAKICLGGDEIIESVRYIYNDGSESETLGRYYHIGYAKDSVLFGDEAEMNIRFILDSNDTITNYDTDVDEFEITNKSERTITVIALKKKLAIPPDTTQVMKKDK